MNCLRPLLCCVACVASFAADPFAEGVRPTEPLSPEEQRATFKVPDGFEMQLVAAEPQLRKPMNMAFDARGRLWVTESREYPFPAPLDKPARDSIRIFEDFDENGLARKMTVFAEGLNIPIGIYPYGNGCIAWSIPNIWHFQDTDGDGKADKKEILYGPFGWERDTHGNQASFRRGWDGWLYATHGFNNNSQVRARDGSEVKMNSGNTYRLALDGGHIEQHTYGQVNPFGLAFDPLGNLYSADCHSSPIYQLLRGAYYPSFGKPDDGLGFAPVLMQHDHGSTAICGIQFVDEDLWPEELQGHIIIGNVMTSRVNHDEVSYLGSSPRAKQIPDLITTTDPWFRPVDLQIAPDGALYVADFYNRIIGHYEVPLTHPGRDRERGRIWRMVPKDRTRMRPLALKGTEAESLIEEMASGSISRRILAMNTLADTAGKSAAEKVGAALANSKDSAQKTHLLWLLQRFEALPIERLRDVSRGGDRQLRVHAMRILSETPNWTDAHRALAHEGLRDADPHIQRAAAEACGVQTSLAHVAPLLRLLDAVEPKDDHLRHVARIALRNQLREDKAWGAIAETTLSDNSTKILVGIAPGIANAGAGEFLLKHLDSLPADGEPRGKALRHIARYAPPEKLDALAEFVREKLSNDVDQQLSILDAVKQGIAQRGMQPSPAINRWAITLAGQVLDEESGWSARPLDPFRPTRNPWFLQKRKSSDGNEEGMFLCSLPPGGEALTGVVASDVFEVPETIAFYMAGHDGYPDKPGQKKNVARLLEEKTRAVLAETYSPRNDLAQKVTWNLEAHKGKRAFIEVTDADTGDAYAWLAVGRFETPVPALPRIDPSQMAARQIAAADIARQFKAPVLKPRIEKVLLRANAPTEARPALANALLSFSPDDLQAALVPALSDATVAPQFGARIARTLVERSNPQPLLTNLFHEASGKLQSSVAAAMAGTAKGAEELLRLIEDGKANPRLLLDRATADKIAATLPASKERIARLTAGLSANEAAQKAIDKTRSEFKATLAPDQGAPIFKQYCAVCHKLKNEGALVGPQLDGIGNRGLDRIIEDIIDPNRNVDRAFRTHVIQLHDGDVLSGLPRREEGELLILADSTGKEISVSKTQIKARKESESSLMPENFGDVIPAAELQKLISYLLAQRGE